MASRAVWSGSISFGLVNIPVQMHRATESRTVSFHQLRRGTGERIRYQRVGVESGEEVAFEDIDKGYEIEPGRYVVVQPEELEAVEPGRSKTIEIEDFVDLREVDPAYFERAYYLVPAAKTGGVKPYALLGRAMEDAGRVAVGRLVLRSKQHLVAIRSKGPVLVLETMYFPDEVRDPVEEVGSAPADVDLSAQELKVARQLLDSLTTSWDPQRYRDTYRERVLDLVERKAKGEDVVTERPSERRAPIVDLMGALEASLSAARGQGSGGDGEASGGGEDLAELSRDELYELAQRRKLSGRSRMTRDELVEALRRAS